MRAFRAFPPLFDVSLFLFLFSTLIHLRLTITWRPSAHSNYMSLCCCTKQSAGETRCFVSRPHRWRPSLSPFILRLSPPLPKSFIAYPTLPTTCYTIPEDTQRGNLCPGIAAACEIRSRVRKSPCTRNAQCDPAYTRFRLAETLLSMDNSAVSLPPPILRHILRRRSRANACRFAIARFVFEMCLASPHG